MSKPHAIRALEKQRAIFRAEIAGHEAKIEMAREGIAHIEATMSILHEAKRNGAPKGRKRRWLFSYGELGPLIREIEAAAGEPLPAYAVAAAIMDQKGWPADDEQLQRFVAMKVRNARRITN